MVSNRGEISSLREQHQLSLVLPQALAYIKESGRLSVQVLQWHLDGFWYVYQMNDKSSVAWLRNCSLHLDSILVCFRRSRRDQRIHSWGWNTSKPSILVEASDRPESLFCLQTSKPSCFRNVGYGLRQVHMRHTPRTTSQNCSPTTDMQSNLVSASRTVSAVRSLR